MKKRHLQILAILFLLGTLIFLYQDLELLHFILFGAGLLFFIGSLVKELKSNEKS